MALCLAASQGRAPNSKRRSARTGGVTLKIWPKVQLRLGIVGEVGLGRESMGAGRCQRSTFLEVGPVQAPVTCPITLRGMKFMISFRSLQA